MSLSRRLDPLSAALPHPSCPTGGYDPNGLTTFRIARDDDPPGIDDPCPECGREPYRFTLLIARDKEAADAVA